MTQKHTPGPWKVSGDRPYNVLAESEHGDSAIASAYNPYPDPEDYSHYLEDWERFERVEREANARLIAAAPDLLEALQLCSTAWWSNADLITHDDPRGHSWNQVESILLARAAIAKARGQA